ncbi:hypothetical protein PPH41_42630, partial [Burkholderia gladioli]|nr:hypothetical protein [Burkholderia gladioli]
MSRVAGREVEPQMRDRAFERGGADQRIEVEAAHAQRLLRSERRAVEVGAAVARGRAAQQVARRLGGRG